MKSLYNFPSLPDFLEDENYRFLKEQVSSTNSLSFLHDDHQDIVQWRLIAKQRAEESLFYSPPRVPLNPSVSETVEFDKYIREKVYFDSAPGCRIPAYLLIPKHLQAPAPAIVTLHDHGGRFYWGKEKLVEHQEGHPFLQSHIDRYYEGMPLASGLAEQGFVVLAIDSLYFGERRWQAERSDSPFKSLLEKFTVGSDEYINQYHRILKEVEPWLVKAIFFNGQTFAGIRTWDDRVSVDYLCSRPEVDAERIGCVGLSVGAQRSAWLSAMDDRIKCSIIVCWMARYKDMTGVSYKHIKWMDVAPGLFQHMDYPDIVSLAAPKPLFIMHGVKDELFPNQTGQKAIEHVRHVYDKAGCADAFEAKLYDETHVFNRSMQQEASHWFKTNL